VALVAEKRALSELLMHLVSSVKKIKHRDGSVVVLFVFQLVLCSLSSLEKFDVLSETASLYENVKRYRDVQKCITYMILYTTVMFTIPSKITTMNMDSNGVDTFATFVIQMWANSLQSVSI
jgi:hypothetical protein